jgi:hypothetical protein
MPGPLCPAIPPSMPGLSCPTARSPRARARGLYSAPRPSRWGAAIGSLLGFVAVAVAAAPAAAGLPVTQPWQQVIRDHLATLQERDFTIDLAPLAFEPGLAPTADDLHKLWLWMANRGYEVTDSTGLRVPAASFLLSSIEADGKVNMCPAQNGFIDPLATAWWATWDYPGNPHRPGTANSKAAKQRAFVCAAVDLVMLDDYHERGQGVRSDFMGGNLIWIAGTYLAVQDILPPPVRAAYLEGLRRLFERIEPLEPHGSGGADIETFQMVGLWYAAQALGSQEYMPRAVKRVHRVIDTIFRPAGYEHHGGAFDVAYMGIALRFVSWAAMLHDDPKLDATLEKMLLLKSHLSLPEPGPGDFTGTFTGPSHFSTGTGPGAPEDAWGHYFRDVACGMKTDAALYLVVGGRSRPYGPVGIADEETMRTRIAGWIDAVNNGPRGDDGLTHPIDKLSPAWQEIHWTHGINHAVAGYRPGFHARMTKLIAERSPLLLMPFARPGDFVRRFGDDFLVAKVGGHGAIVHTGPVRDRWADHVAGLGGGGLSAYWTPESGAVILGLNGGSQLPTHERWEAWRTWAVHAVSGESEAGKPFSSARNRQPDDIVVKQSGDSGATVSFTGRIGGHDGGMSAPDGAVTGQVTYAREITIDGTRLAVRTKVTSDGQDRVKELWETVPLYLKHDGQKDDATIEFDAGGWRPAAEGAVDGVKAVRITRHGKPVTIAFDGPRRVALSAVSERGKGFTRTLLVDLLGGHPGPLPAATEIAWEVR